LSPASLAGKRVLVANRGEIALRVVRTCRALGCVSIAAHSDADADMPFVREADERVRLGPAPARESYLDIARVVEAARNLRADAVHPGYGFLSENADFAETVEAAGIAFVGPTAEQIRLLGNKVRAKEAAEKAGVPVNRGSPGRLADAAAAAVEADRIGYPVLLKAAAGGGGRGMRIVAAGEEMEAAFRASSAEALASFGRADLFLERLLRPARHVEVQVFGDGKGEVAALGERECSVQRRHQKVIEEAPSPAVDPGLRKRLSEAAIALAATVDYRGAGTVEFLLGPDGSFFFLEMNCRLQVEHPVTEAVLGVDLVAAQLRLALAGEMTAFPPGEPRGWAVECRLNAEDPARDFVPSTGRILALEVPHGGAVRFDGGFAPGTEVSPHYDSLLGKLVCWGATREEAVARSREALDRLVVLGPRTNARFLGAVLDHPEFRAGRISTTFLDETFAGWTGGNEDEDEAAGSDPSSLAAAVAFLLEGEGGNGAAAENPTPWATLPGWRTAGRAGA